MQERTYTRLPGDRVVVCTEAKPFDANGERLPGIVLRMFSNGRILVDVGTGKRNKHGDLDRDARVFDPEKVACP